MSEAGSKRQQPSERAKSRDPLAPATRAATPDAATLAAGLDLIRGIYAATAGETSWQHFTDELSSALDGATVVFALTSPNEPRVEKLIAASAEAVPTRHQCDGLLEASARSDESQRRARMGFVAVAAESGAPNLLHLIAVVHAGADAAIIAFRAPGEDAFSTAERALVERLLPHLRRAYGATQHVFELSQQNAALAEVLNRLAAGILLLDEGAKLRFRNRAARRVLARGDGLEVIGGALRAMTPESDGLLQRLIGEVVAPSAHPDAGGTLAVWRPSVAARYPVSVSRLLPGDAHRNVVACVLVSDPDSGVMPAVELVRSLHCLTPTESELVEQLALGRTVEEASRSRGVSVNTTRSHLKQVFRKTGTHRQGELVQLVLRSFVPVVEE